MSLFSDLKPIAFEVRNAPGSSLLMHSPLGMKPSGSAALGRKQIPSPEEEAEAGCYRMPSGQIYAPGTWAMGAILTAASGMKIQKKAANQILSAGLFIMTDIMPLVDPEDAAPLREYEIDIQRCVVQRQGIMRARPKLVHWSTEVRFEYDPNLLNEQIIEDILTLSGRIAGWGDFRPAKKGPHGRFIVRKQ